MNKVGNTVPFVKKNHHIIHKYTNHSINTEDTYLKVCVYMGKHVTMIENSIGD